MSIGMSRKKSVRCVWQGLFRPATLVLVMACSAGWQTSLASEDEKPSAAPAGAGSESDSTKEKTDDKTEQKPDKSADDPRDEDLLKSLKVDGMGDDDVADIDQLDRAIQAMRDAQQRMEADEAGGKTLELQRQAIRDLTALIEKIKNPPPQDQQNSDQQNQDQNQDKSKSKSKQSKGRKIRRLVKSQKGSAMPENAGEPKTAQNQAEQPGSNSDNAKDSSENVDPKKAAEAEAARQRQLVKDVWGHLPPALREELLNVYSEKYLPRYEDLVRRYYEALAEKQKNRGR